MTTTKRRGFGSQVDALLDGPAAPVPSQPAAAPTVAPAAAPTAPASSASARRSNAGASARPRRSAAALEGDDDGPRLRASERSTLAGGDVRRTVYVGADEWRAVLRLAMRRGCTASDVTRAALADYLRRHGGGSSA